MSIYPILTGIHYDFIGKYETIDEDVQYILGKLNATDSYPDKMMGPTSLRHKGKSKTMEEWYKDVREDALADIREIYEKDFKVLGYDPNKF